MQSVLRKVNFMNVYRMLAAGNLNPLRPFQEVQNQLVIVSLNTVVFQAALSIQMGF